MSRDSIRARVAAATEGPWVESGRDVDHDRFVSEGKNPGSVCGLGCEVDGPPEPMLRGQFHKHADAAFIAHARQDIPALLRVAEAAARDMENCAGCKADERGYCYRHNETGPTLRDLDALP